MQKVFTTWIRNAALLFAVAIIGASTGLAQVTVDLSQLVGRPGESGVVAVNLSNVEAGTAITAWGFTDIVTDGDIVFTGITEEGTLVEAANFFSETGLPGNDTAGGFAQGTSITTSGTLIYLNFDLVGTGAGTITLAGFQLNNGDPAIEGGVAQGSVVVSDRMLAVEEMITREDSSFTVKINVEDAFIAADDIFAFSVDVNYDPSAFTIDKTRGVQGVITENSFDGDLFASGNDIGGENSGVYRIAGFVQRPASGTGAVGSGLFLELAAIGGNVAGIEGPGETTVTLTNVQFNNGEPLYGAFPGVVNVLPYNVATEDDPETPATFTLDGNYPNPFNPSTTIQFDLPESAVVSVQVMDLLGREVMSVPASSFTAGSNQSIQLNASALTSGLYLYRVVAQGQTATHVRTGSMTLLK